MPYSSETSQYERRSTTVIDATPDGDTVAVAIDVKLDQGIDDYVTDLNHHAANGRHYPATSVASDSRFLRQSPAGEVSWADGVVAANAALKDFSNVASGAIAPAKIAQDANNRFATDAEKSTWNGALYDKADVEAVLTGTITSHSHAAETLPTASETVPGIVELATTTEASTGTDTSRAVTGAGVTAAIKAKLNVSGDAPMYACRAWANFDGTTTPPTIRGSGNVSSVARNVAGDYTINFTEAMTNANYSVVMGLGISPARPSVIYTTSTGSVRVGSADSNTGVAYNNSIVMVAIFS